MNWTKEIITINDKNHIAIVPMIISASRSTDIPAFYAKDFFDYLEKGYLFWINPFNRKKSLIGLSKTRFIVFWTKNPLPIIPYLERIQKKGINFYFNYTLNNYEKEGLEANLPVLKSRIATFKKLSSLIGRDKVVWRFDPLILAKGSNFEVLLDKINEIAIEIHSFTNKLVVSFVDISYKKVRSGFNTIGFETEEFNKHEFIEKLYFNMRPFGIDIYTCAEPENLNLDFVKKNKCIDDQLIEKLSAEDEVLMSFIKKIKDNNTLKDKGQREFCECMVSKDIGRYNSCKYGCSYCYAGSTTERSEKLNIFE